MVSFFKLMHAVFQVEDNPMTTSIKNGTVVTADLTYKADVRVDNGVITEIGQGLPLTAEY